MNFIQILTLENMSALIQGILVPAGAEYRAVKRGLKRIRGSRPQVVVIPAGPQALQGFLAVWEGRHQLQSSGMLLMGLGGSLSPDYDVGDGVLLETVWYVGGTSEAKAYGCNPSLTTQISEQLGIAMGNGVTCDRIITTAAEKRQLRDRYCADVVDMESAALLQALPRGHVAVLRIISDGCHHDLPDISTAIASDGSLQPLPLILGFLRQPLSALRFVWGSLQALKALENQTVELFK